MATMFRDDEKNKVKAGYRIRKRSVAWVAKASGCCAVTISSFARAEPSLSSLPTWSYLRLILLRFIARTSSTVKAIHTRHSFQRD
jgi:hypothetical protein